jgi:hypothetical protein
MMGPSTSGRRRQVRAATAFILAGAVIIGFGTVDRLRQPPPPDDVPPLRILEPASGDSLNAPLVVRFSTPAGLRLDPRLGWAAGDLHLHLILDGTEIMPAAGDITDHGDGTFAWRVAAARPGPVRLHLTWAGPDHRRIDGPADTIRIRLAP